MIVIYDSRVVIWGIFKSGMTLESFIRLATGLYNWKEQSVNV